MRYEVLLRQTSDGSTNEKIRKMPRPVSDCIHIAHKTILQQIKIIIISSKFTKFNEEFI